MKRIFLAFFLFALSGFAAYTEFYARSGGSNLNAGSTNVDAAAFTYAGGTFVRATGVFTVASGNPQTDGVAVGDWVSIYTTSGATVANCVALVTARDTTTITIGAAPTFAVGAVINVSEVAAAATAKVAGAWAGMSAGVAFPLSAVLNTAIKNTNEIPRLNCKGTFTTNSTTTHNLNGPIRIQGYTTTAGDGGRFTIDASAASSANCLNISGNNVTIADFIAYNNTGNASGLIMGGIEGVALRCVAHKIGRQGINIGALNNVAIECEAYDCNSDNNVNGSGFVVSTNSTLIRCISHDSAYGTACNGFQFTDAAVAIDCIADTNAGAGFNISGIKEVALIGCDAYNNAKDGFDFSGGANEGIYMENCNAIKNGTGGTGYGFNSSGSAVRNGAMYNCGLGAGTQANATGGIATALAQVEQIGTITYVNDVTPWTDPANGDFRISLATAKASGRGSFLQTSGYASPLTVGYPAVGAAQPSAAATATQTSYGFSK